jgi:hypothetical protein
VVAVGSAVVAVVPAVVAVVAAVVAEPPPPPLPADAVAITGAAGLADGVTVVMPDFGMVLFGYVVQVRLREAPDTATEIDREESRVKLMAPPDAVKGPTVSGGFGSCMETPAAGIGLGIGELIWMAAPESEAGVAPVASTLVEAVPVMTELPMACTAFASAYGRLTVV